MLLAACSAAPEGEGAPVPKTQQHMSVRAFGDPQCGIEPQTIPWVNPFRNNPSTLPFYADDGSIPVGGAVAGVDVPATVWFEQRLWTLIGYGPGDPDSTVASHPSTVPGYTWNAIQAVPADGYGQTDFDKLLSAYADVDPVDSSIPQCSYGAPVNIAWDPTCTCGCCLPSGSGGM